jgi:hypothetical protein
LSIRNARRHEPLAARRLDAAQLAIELLRIRLQSRQIGVGISGVLNRMIAVEKARNIQVGADVLDHHVRRIAPAADRDVSVRQRKAVRRGLIGAAHDSMLVRVACERPDTSNTFARARSCRTWAAIFCWPSADRSASSDRSAALAPVSTPSDVALSGAKRT